MPIKLIVIIIASLYLPNLFAKDTTTQPAQTRQATLPKKWNSHSRAVYDLLIAQMQHAGADYAGSVDTLVKFAKTNKDEKLYSKAFKALLQTARYEDAVALVTQWKKDTDRDVDHLHVLALTLNNNIDLALETVDQIYTQNGPDFASNFALVALTNLLQTHWYKTEVTALLLRLYEQYADNEVIAQAYVDQLRWQGDTEGAAKIIDKLRFDDPRNVELAQKKSDIYRYAVRPEAAKKVWIDLLTDYPNEPLFQLAYAQFLFDSYAFTEALAQAETITASDLEDAAKLLQIMALIQLENYDQATAMLTETFSEGEDKQRAQFVAAGHLAQKKQYRLVETVLSPLVDFNDNDPDEWALPAALEIGQARYALHDDVSKGDDWFDQVANHFHLSAEEKLQESANALSKAGLDSLAYKRLSTFIAQNPNHENMRYTRGIIAAEMGLNKAAIEDLKVIHSASPDNIDVQNALGYTLLGNDNTLDQGASLVEKALFSKPNSPAIVDSMGWVLYRRGEMDAALPYFRYAYGNYLDGEIIGHAILALDAAGKPEMAKKLYQLEIQYPPNVKKINQHVKPIIDKLQD